MNKIVNHLLIRGINPLWNFLLTIMRIFLLLITIGLGTASANSTFSQTKLDIDVSNVTLEDFFTQIQNKSEFVFFYKDDILNSNVKISLNLKDATLPTILNQAFSNINLNYKIDDRQVIVIAKEETPNNTFDAPQGYVVKGTIVNTEGYPLPGANVIQKGTTRGSHSNFDGTFSLTVSSQNTTLVVSYLGYVTQEVPLNNQTSVDIILQEDNARLDEVVVIAYGTVKKSDLTGAVSSVKSEEIIMTPAPSPIEALQGRVAGLDITRGNGRSGSGMNILLRGNRSLTANANPIYIIDGIQGNIENLNPNDIDSIEVLKDASSTAIYGSAGANGVIIITTKKGTEGKIQVDFNSYVSINDNPSFPSPLQGDAWLQYLEDGYVATNGSASPNRDALLSAWNLTPATLNSYIDGGKYVDWTDETFQTGIQTNNTLSIRGGTEKLTASFSLGHNKTEGIYAGDAINIYTLRNDLSVKAADWLKFGVTTGLIYKDRDQNRSRVNKSFSAVPLGDVYDENGDIKIFPIDDEPGYVSVLANNVPGTYVNNSKSFNFTANPYIDINLLKGLTLRSILGASVSSSRDGEFQNEFTYNALAGSGNNVKSASYNTSLDYSYNWENILTYKTTFNEIHNLGLTFISSYAHYQNENGGGYSEGFISDNNIYYDLDGGTQNLFVNSDYSMTKRMSYAGRFNYDFKNKYFFTASVRADGASQLAEGNQWDIFPAGALAWKISDEEFMENTKSWLTTLKLRAGYGVTGNSIIGAYSSSSGVISGQNNLNLGSGQVPTYILSQTVSNSDLGWEKSYNSNIGLDIGFLHNKVYASVEYYNTDTKDVIYNRGLPSTIGGAGPKSTYVQFANIAETNSNGIEVTLTSHNIKTDNFKWETTLTFSSNKEEVVAVDLGNTSVEDLRSLGLFIGSPAGVVFDYKKTGIWQLDEAADAAVFGLEPGDVKIESSLTRESEGVWTRTVENEDGTTTVETYDAANPYAINANDDKQIIGQQNPKWTAGLQNTFTYKNLDLSIFATARQGHMINAQLLGYFKYGQVNTLDIYDYWTPTNPTNDYPRPYISRSTSNSEPVQALNYVDGSYFKIKNITLGYSLPKKFIEKFGVTKFRLYGTMYNSLIITKSHLLDGIDPETNASDSFPLYKQTVFGLNVSF